MNFIFNEDPDRISKKSVFCSLHFTADSFTNKAQFDVGFSMTILDPMWHHTSVSNCFYYVITIASSLLTDRLIYIELFMCF